MKHATLIAFSIALFFAISANAQNNLRSTESSAVSTTVKNYIEAYYAGDARRMEQTLHPRYLKHVIHHDLPMREMSGQQLTDAIRSEGRPDISKEEQKEEVTVLDISGNVASAKLVAAHWVDYMTLSKSQNGWRILSVVQQIEN